VNGEIVLERYSEVIGLPVICVEDGKRLGIIKDVLFKLDSRSVDAFLLERKGCEVAKKVVLLKDVVSLGKDAMIINDCTCVKKVKKEEYRSRFKERRSLHGMKVYSKKGRDFGVVKDVLFDYKTGSIEGVEVSDGLLQDIYSGRNILPLFGKVEFSSENILVDNEAVEEMMDTGGGIKRRLLEG
jgi:uncharacterized protein YrrD